MLPRIVPRAPNLGAIYKARCELLTELSGLSFALETLSGTGDLGLDIDLGALRLALEQCAQACDPVCRISVDPRCPSSPFLYLD